MTDGPGTAVDNTGRLQRDDLDAVSCQLAAQRADRAHSGPHRPHGAAPGTGPGRMRGTGAHHPRILRHIDRGDPLMDPLMLLIIDYLRSAHRGHLLGLACGITASCPGVTVGGTRPGILTGVLKATMSDPQVTTPAPRYDPGSHSKKSRRHGQPTPTVPSRTATQPPARTRQQPQPAPTRTGP